VETRGSQSAEPNLWSPAWFTAPSTASWWSKERFQFDPLRSQIHQMQRLYCRLNAEDQKVYTAWLRKILVLWAFILAAVVTICAVRALDTSLTPDWRIPPLNQLGVFP